MICVRCLYSFFFDLIDFCSFRGMECVLLIAYISGKLSKNLVRTLGLGRHGDGNGLYLVVDPSSARRWIVRVTVKGHRYSNGGPVRTDFGLGGVDVITLNVARERALEYRRLAKHGLNPRFGHRLRSTFRDWIPEEQRESPERRHSWRARHRAAAIVSGRSRNRIRKTGSPAAYQPRRCSQSI